MSCGVLRASSCHLVILALLATVVAGTLRGQESSPRNFGESVVVDLVNVEVWVTDGKGRPVTGLTADDFEVREDGRPVTVTHFREVAARATETVTSVSPESPPVESVPVESQAGESDPAEDVGHLVIYFDDLHLRLGGRKRMIKDLRSFLEQTAVPPEQILIVRQDSKLTAENLFGSDAEQIDAALSRLEKPDGRSTIAQQQRWLTLAGMQDAWERIKETVPQGTDPCDALVPTVDPDVRRYAQESHVRIRQSLGHLSNMVTFLAGVPGVKTLLYMSDALQMAPGEELLRFTTDLCPATPRRTTPVALGAELSDEFRRLTRHASANRVTIYSLQPEGLRGGFIGSAQQGTLDMRGSRSMQSAIRNNEREGMSYIAYETGGRAVFNQNSLLPELIRIDAELSSHYSLAYAPPGDSERIEHRIEVEVKGDYRVRHRRGYREKTRQELTHERLEGALYLGLVSNPLSVRLAAGEAIPQGNKNQLRLHILLPVDRLVFLPVEGGAMSNVAVTARAQRENGRRETEARRVFQVMKPPEDGPESIDLILPLEVADGVYDIAVAVRDEASNQASFVSTVLRVSRRQIDSG